MARTVLIVDDHAEVRSNLRHLIESDGYDVVGESGDGRQALQDAALLRPDVVLLDVRLPDGSGVDVARTLTSVAEPPIVVLMSTGDYASIAARCGASGFIAKASFSADAFRQVVER